VKVADHGGALLGGGVDQYLAAVVVS
jgi:hypothetical protein